MKRDLAVKFLRVDMDAKDVAEAVNRIVIDECGGFISLDRIGFSHAKMRDDGEIETEHTFIPLESREQLSDYFRDGLNGKWNLQLNLETFAEVSPLIYRSEDQTSLILWLHEGHSEGYVSSLYCHKEWRRSFAELLIQIADRIGSLAVTACDFDFVPFTDLQQMKESSNLFLAIWKQGNQVSQELKQGAVELEGGYLWNDRPGFRKPA